MANTASIRAFDIIGDLTIVEIPKTQVEQSSTGPSRLLSTWEAKQGEKAFAARILTQQKNIKAVYKRVGGHEGKLRLQKLKHILGEKRTVTTHKENNVLLKLDIARVYFSPRQATERKRVYEQVKKPETILVMFSGIGPFAIEIAKNTPAKSVYGVELNKTAHKYATVNAKINKVESKVKLICGNVRKIIPKLKKKFSRIVMPLPKGAESFLNVAFAAAKKGTTIHFYDFEKEEDVPQKAKEKVIKAAAAAKKKIKILNVVKCGQLAPRAYRVCVDFKVL